MAVMEGMGYLSHELDNLERILDGMEKPGKLKLPVLRLITANFSNDRKIGEGGFCSVYKGILQGRGKMVAVKLFNSTNTLDERVFQQEVTTLMSVEHKNIVQFVGYCSHTEEEMVQMTRKYIFAEARERLLCFEYISNGSLADHITDELRGHEWEKRFQIIEGICEGLRYLHKKENGIIHMDLKPANILLTDALVPKITDFGTSRLQETAKTMTQKRVFSLGYCCPEYIVHGERTCSSDIYSLGVTIIEIVTGTKEDKPNITNVCRRWRHRWNKSAEHATLLLALQQVTGCLELAQRCKNKEPTKRPDIVNIIDELNKMNSSDASKSIGEHPSKKQKSIVEQQKKSFLDHMLGIQPLESHFSPKCNEQIEYSIQLTNDTEDYVAFMIHENTMDSWVSATRRLPLSMHPSKDILPPESSCSVTITVEALKKPLQEQFVGKLCVQSTRVDEGLKANDITEDMFKEEANKVVDVVDLTVKVSTPKQLLVVKPLELCYGPIQPNKLLACTLQLTNTTDDYVAFWIILPQSNMIRYYQMICAGIIPPCSTRGVITEILVMEEAPAEMQCKDMCLVRSVVVKKDLMEHDVSVELFNEQTGVHEMELDIVFAEPFQALSSSAHRPTHEETTLHMDDHGLEDLTCIDVHPTEPWFVTGHSHGTVCIWKVDPKTNASEVIISTPDAYKLVGYQIESVKFIARKKWVACGDDKGCVTVYTYEDNRLTKFKTIQIKSRCPSAGFNEVRTLAVHPTLPYLLTILSGSDLILRWDWDQDWTCTGKFVPPERGNVYAMDEITFNPKDDNTFACSRLREYEHLFNDNEILVFSMDSQKGTTKWRGRDTYSIAYCSTGVLATLDSLMHDGKIEILDLSSETRVHTLADKKLTNGNDELEDPYWCMACHPTRPLLATANWELGVFLWNCATYGLQKVFKFSPREYEGIGFIDVEGFQRLVIASPRKIQMVDILDGVTVFREITSEEHTR